MASETVSTGNADKAGDLSCCICLKIFEDPKILLCGHTFCCSCLNNILDKKKISCPLCRKITEVTGGNAKELATNFSLNNIIHNALDFEEQCEECDATFPQSRLFYCACSKFICVNCKDNHSKCLKKGAEGKISEYPILPDSKCDSHSGNLKTKVCLTCSKELCTECEETHKGHNVKCTKTYVKELRSQTHFLQEEMQTLRKEVRESHQAVVRNRERGDGNLIKLEQDISFAYEKLVQHLDDRKKALEQSMKEIKNRFKKLENSMTDLSVESTRLLEKVKQLKCDVYQSPLKEMQLQVISLKKITNEMNEMRSRQHESRIMSDDIFNSVEKMHFEENSDGEGDLIGTLTMHDWRRTDIPLRDNTMSCATLGKDGKVAVGYQAGGISLFSKDGPTRTVLKDVKVLAIAYLKGGDLVLRDATNKISIYKKLKKVNVNFVTPDMEKGGGGNMAVNDKNEIFVSYALIKEIYVYIEKGGTEIRKVTCSPSIPQQIFLLGNSRILIMDASVVRIIDKEGKFVSAFTRDGHSGYPAVSSDGSLYIAWIHQTERNVRIVRRIDESKSFPLVLTDSSLCHPGRDWYQLVTVSDEEIVLISPDTMHLYNRHKTNFNPDNTKSVKGSSRSWWNIIPGFVKW